jgi:hypothetical protein
MAKTWAERGRYSWAHDGRRSPRLKNIVGQRFGTLVVVGLLPREHTKQRVRYRCLCDCGKEWDTAGHHLLGGKTKSCGCGRNIKARNESSFNYVFDMITGGARARDISFELTKDQVKFITSQNCHYCHIPPSKVNQRSRHNSYTWNGIDRVKSDGCYTLDNCVPCCEMCNRMKRDYPQDKFLEQVGKIASIWAQIKLNAQNELK